jgi:hypothetical protein
LKGHERTKTIKIFTVGQHTAGNGVTLNFESSVLEACAAVYNARGIQAPLCIGHPEDDKPEWGKVLGLFVKAGGMYAYASLSNSLRDAVAQGAYRYVSAAFRSSGMRNPSTPAALSLRHVGFLGAWPPGVRGLGPVEFVDATGRATPGLKQFAFSQPVDAGGFESVGVRLVNGAPLCDARIYGVSSPDAAYVTPDSALLYSRAKEMQRLCPSLTFGEAAVLADKFSNPKP